MKSELLKLLCRNARYTNEELAVMLSSDEKTVANTNFATNPNDKTSKRKNK